MCFLMFKVKELRRPVSKLESLDGGHQGKKRKAEYTRQRAKKLSESQEQARNGEQELDEPSSKMDKVLNELRDFKDKLPGMVLTMLGELGLTNISGPGGVVPNQRYLMRGDNTDKEIEGESTNDRLHRAFSNVRNQYKRNDGPQDSRKIGKILTTIERTEEETVVCTNDLSNI